MQVLLGSYIFNEFNIFNIIGILSINGLAFIDFDIFVSIDNMVLQRPGWPAEAGTRHLLQALGCQQSLAPGPCQVLAPLFYLYFQPRASRQLRLAISYLYQHSQAAVEWQGVSFKKEAIGR